MIPLADICMALFFLSVLLSLASNRLMGLVRIMAFQGVLVSLLPLLLGKSHAPGPIDLGFLGVTMLIKAVAMPLALYTAVKKIANLREVEPVIGYHASIFSGLLLMLTAGFISHRLTPFMPPTHGMLLPVDLTAIGAGFFLMMARRKAITQVIGYLMLENGIYLIGTTLAQGTHSQYILEFGVLLDLLAGVMIMGIILYRISSAFDDIDTGVLGSLKD